MHKIKTLFFESNQISHISNNFTIINLVKIKLKNWGLLGCRPTNSGVIRMTFSSGVKVMFSYSHFQSP